MESIVNRSASLAGRRADSDAGALKLRIPCETLEESKICGSTP